MLLLRLRLLRVLVVVVVPRRLRNDTVSVVIVVHMGWRHVTETRAHRHGWRVHSKWRLRVVLVRV